MFNFKHVFWSSSWLNKESYDLQNIVALIFLTFSFKCSWHILGYSEAVLQKCSVKRVFLNISQNLYENYCAGVSFHKVAGWLEKRLQQCFSENFARFFRTPILYNICERLLLLLVRIGLVWRAANLSMFHIIVFKSVF